MLATLLRIAVAIAAPAATGEASPAEPAPGPGFEYRAEGKVLWVTAPAGQSYQIELPCSGVATAVHAARLFVACGDDGVAVLSLEAPSTPQLIGVRDLGGTVVGFHEAGGALWAELVRREARLVGEPVSPGSEGTPSTAPAAGTPGSMPPPASSGPGVAPSVTEPSHAEGAPGQAPPERAGQGPALAPPHMVAMGEVVDVRGSRAIVTLGRATGLAPGDHVGFYALRKLSLGGGQVASTEEVLAVGVARVVADERAEVELGTDEVVPRGASVRRTSAPVTADRWLPPRAAGVWELGFTLRPFLPIGALGVGTVSDASVGIRLPSDVHLVAVFEPLSVALANAGNVFSAAGNVFASYDTRYFEVGLGAGWSAVNNEDPIYHYDETTGVQLPGLGLVDSGFSLGQVVRLGAVDGLHLAARNTFVLYRSEFHYGSTVAELMVPATDRAWVFARGGGGAAAGFAYGELGLRMLLSGNGGPQSVFASASLGGADVWGKREVNCGGPGEQFSCYDEDSYAGPLVGFGLEWRP